MELTILGNNGPFAAPGGVCSGYLLQNEGHSVLIDCGPGTLARLEKYCSIGSLDAIMLSHLHYDHISDIYSGIYNLQAQMKAGNIQHPILLFAPDAPESVLGTLKCNVLNVVSLDNVLDTDQNVQIGGMNFSFMRVRHPLPAFAIKARHGSRTFVYTGDTNTCEGLAEFCRDADVLLCDIGLTRAQWSESAPHLSAELGGKLACEAGVGKLIGTHINPRADIGELLCEMREFCPQAILAEMDMKVTI